MKLELMSSSIVLEGCVKSLAFIRAVKNFTYEIRQILPFNLPYQKCRYFRRVVRFSNWLLALSVFGLSGYFF